MRVRGWPGTWLALASALLLVARAFGDEFSDAPPVPLSTDASCFGDPSLSCDQCSRDADSCDAGCCQAECCNSCFDDCYCPGWTVRAGAIFLRRDNQSDVPLSNGTPGISVADLAFHDYRGGPMVTLMRNHIRGSMTSLEVTYFGIQDTNSAATAGATTVFSVPNINFGANTVAANYRSSLNSTEINFRDSWTERFTFLGGFRWVELGDKLAMNIGNGLASYEINANNHLYGAQLGAEISLVRSGRFSVDWFGKAGVYGNSADQSTTTAGIAGAQPAFSARDGKTVFLGELDLTGRYALSEHWSILGGYRAIWLTGIALAPNQIASSNIATGAATLDNDSSPIYHGFTVAGELVW